MTSVSSAIPIQHLISEPEISQGSLLTSRKRHAVSIENPEDWQRMPELPDLPDPNPQDDDATYAVIQPKLDLVPEGTLATDSIASTFFTGQLDDNQPFGDAFFSDSDDEEIDGGPEGSALIKNSETALAISKNLFDKAYSFLEKRGLLPTPQHQEWALQNPQYVIGFKAALTKLKKTPVKYMFKNEVPRDIAQAFLTLNESDCGTQKDFILGWCLLFTKTYGRDLRLTSSTFDPRSIPYFEKLITERKLWINKINAIAISKAFPILKRHSILTLDNLLWFAENVDLASTTTELLKNLERLFPPTQVIFDTIRQLKYRDHLQTITEKINALSEEQKTLNPDSFEADLDVLIPNSRVEVFGRANSDENAQFNKAFEALGQKNLLLTEENREWANRNPRYVIGLDKALPLLQKAGKTKPEIMLALISKMLPNLDESDSGTEKDFIEGLNLLHKSLPKNISGYRDQLIANPRIIPYFNKTLNQSTITTMQLNKAFELFKANPASFEVDFRDYLAIAGAPPESKRRKRS